MGSSVKHTLRPGWMPWRATTSRTNSSRWSRPATEPTRSLTPNFRHSLAKRWCTHVPCGLRKKGAFAVISKVARSLHRTWKLLRTARSAMSCARHESSLAIVSSNLEAAGEAWPSRLVAVIDDTREMLSEYTGCTNVWVPSGYIDALDRTEDSCRGADQGSRAGGPRPGSPPRLSRDPCRVWEGLWRFRVHWDDRGRSICVFLNTFWWETCPACWPQVLQHLLPTGWLCSQVERCCGCYYIFDPSWIEIHGSSVSPGGWKSVLTFCQGSRLCTPLHMASCIHAQCNNVDW